MPLPLKPGENIYIDHKIKEASYAMPAMQAAHDHYTIGYMVSGDRRWIATDNIRVCHAGDFGIAKPEVYHRNCPISDVPYDRYVIKVRTEVFEPIIKIIGHTQLDILCRNYLHFTKASQNEIQKMCDEMLYEYALKDVYKIFQSPDFAKYCSMVGKDMASGYVGISTKMVKQFGTQLSTFPNFPIT